MIGIAVVASACAGARVAPPTRADVGRFTSPASIVRLYVAVRHAIMKTSPRIVVCFPALTSGDEDLLVSRGFAASVRTDTTCRAKPVLDGEDGLLVIERIERGDTSRVFGVFTQKESPRWWREQFMAYRFPVPGGHQLTVGEFGPAHD
ncbi:MAG: hypothetical protein H0W15_13075 [Gemmatimonadales bacterium]|nr:hypothetical protein [Gemmatimonadales bacterium]